MIDLLSRPVRSEPIPRRGRGRKLAAGFFRSAAALAIVAGGVSVSLVVAPPSHALAIAPLIPPIIEGATEAVGAEVITGALVSNPIGWGILAVGAVGVGLYATKDYWMPWVAGQFGSGQSSQASGSAAGVHVIPGLNLSLTSPPNANTVRVNVTWNGGTGSFTSFHIAYIQQCQFPASTGIATATGGLRTVTNVEADSNMNSPVNVNLDYQCDGYAGGVTYYGVPVSFKAGLAGTDGLPPLPTTGNIPPSGGPANEVMTGTFKSGQFDPKDPNTKYTTTVECIDQFGAKSNLSADSFGNAGAVHFPSCAAAGKGHGTGVMSVVGFAPGSGAGTTLWQTTAPTANPSEPLCSPELPSDGCAYSISIDGKPCVVGDVQCENWPAVDAGDSAHTRVSCNHGPYVAVLAACGLLEKAYFPGGAPATAANIDGNPATGSNTDPNGTPIPQPAPVNTGTIPGGAGQPGAGVSPNPASTDSSDCFPNGWGVFNPVEWIQKPMGCALSWAFVPKGTTMTQLEAQVKTDVDRVGFTPIETAVVGMFAPLGTIGSGCQGPPVTFAMHGQSDTFYPFQACTAPMSTAAFVCNALTTMIFIIGGGMGFLRAISSAFGYDFSFGRGSAA